MSLPEYRAYKDSGVTWLGKIPSHWALSRLKDMAEVINGFPFDSKLFEASGTYPLVRIRDLNASETATRYSGEFLESAAVTSSDVLIGMDGDFNVGRWLGKQTAMLNQRMCCVRTPCQALSTFLLHALPIPLKAINDVTYSTTVKHLSSINVEKIQFALPIDEELVAISTFLDRETAKIDALITEQEKLIALLAEKRQATISQAVTKGINSDAPMKDSGVSWLGDIPAHWSVKRMKHIVRESIAGPYGSSLRKSMYTDSGYRVYGQQQVILNDFTVGDYYIPAELFSEMTRYQIMPGDVLVSVMGTIGRAAVVPADVEHGIINPRLVLYRVNNQLIFPKYLQHFLNNSTSQNYFSLAAQGTTMEGLNMASIGELYIPLPPLEEQLTLTDFINRKNNHLTSLETQSKYAIELLNEYRAALISASVTGQIDVRQTFKALA